MTVELIDGAYIISEGFSVKEYLDITDASRTDLLEGCIYVNPRPARRHQYLLHDIAAIVQGSLRPDQKVLPEGNLRINDSNMPSPDILVHRLPSTDDPIAIEASAVELVIEITSPSTRHVDFGVKKELYEAAGIPRYWIVDTEANIVHQTGLADWDDLLERIIEYLKGNPHQ